MDEIDSSDEKEVQKDRDGIIHEGKSTVRNELEKEKSSIYLSLLREWLEDVSRERLKDKPI